MEVGDCGKRVRLLRGVARGWVKAQLDQSRQNGEAFNS